MDVKREVPNHNRPIILSKKCRSIDKKKPLHKTFDVFIPLILTAKKKLFKTENGPFLK